MKSKILIFLAGSLLAFAGCATPPSKPVAKISEPPPAAPAQQLAPLKLFFDGSDYYTVATVEGQGDAEKRGYHFVRTEGFVFTQPQNGLIPLKQYWSAPRHDFWLLAGDIPKNVERNGKYKFVRWEGYVFSNRQPGTVELNHFSKPQGDNFTFASEASAAAAREGGYARRKIFHAYLIPPVETSEATAGTAENFINNGDLVLKNDRFETPKAFRPPVEITIVAKTDSTNLRMGYAADQIIFNWENDEQQLRVDGGPANGQHKPGAGGIPVNKFVTIRWLVLTNRQAIYVDGDLRFEHHGDYSGINKTISVFSAKGSTVTVKSVAVKPLSSSDFPETTNAPPSNVEIISGGQIQNWIAQLGAADFSKRENAVRELAQNSAAALPALKAALEKESDGDRRWWLQSAIQQCEKLSGN